ncbi:GNAT family N-acetyltransferase [Rhodocytophaga rosea]|uniref:GNAT family N-acetyltransferase n=1 Tax=Rhodocytophaga rosea TaxID=2704465 RepID=A0A6C0GPL5_9BACT|nr:GNAT family N-acetyltransferase [Rhodocytophaga rosea]QHT69971.1 GNAT family N-acetyltransferase [Rhodocytophaga rosea]
MEAIHFRLATNSDRNVIIELVKSSLTEFNLTYSPESSDRDLQDIEMSYMHNGGTFEVLENEASEIIGTIALLKIDNTICKLRKMYVRKNERGKGLGSRLLTRIIEKARQSGFSQIILETEHSMKAAINLYKKFGFSAIASQAVSPRCDIVMKLDLLCEKK